LTPSLTISISSSPSRLATAPLLLLELPLLPELLELAQELALELALELVAYKVDTSMHSSSSLSMPSSSSWALKRGILERSGFTAFFPLAPAEGFMPKSCPSAAAL
jgi:hypothetical protein